MDKDIKDNEKNKDSDGEPFKCSYCQDIFHFEPLKQIITANLTYPTPTCHSCYIKIIKSETKKELKTSILESLQMILKIAEKQWSWDDIINAIEELLNSDLLKQ